MKSNLTNCSRLLYVLGARIQRVTRLKMTLRDDELLDLHQVARRAEAAVINFMKLAIDGDLVPDGDHNLFHLIVAVKGATAEELVQRASP